MRLPRVRAGNDFGVPDPKPPRDVSRKSFLVRTSVPSLAAAIGASTPAPPATAGEIAPRDGAPSLASTGTGPVPVRLTVNGRRHDLVVEPRVTLLDALREYAGMPGTKKGCDQGTCGACTVLVNGRRIDACLTLAIMHERDRITTIEGLAEGDALHPMQAAFLERDGFQCGYCTPGQIVSAVGLLAEKRPLDDASVREFMSGNICRCGAYANIVAAVRDAAGRIG